MVKIVIENLGKKEVPVKDFSHSVLRHLHSNSVDWMHACGGKGRCTTCKMIIVEGGAYTSPLTPAENEYRRQGALRENERLACQVRVTADILIRVPEEYKLPHVKYSQ